ncbi:CalY family protein [Bacillus infantis]|uniref:CalY family protein n=1 Tax=Bacillus infantis TaxID=324767 RepID=UPI001CD37545|nr:CalY family protein [Bacillus infantis]MCA1035628.1 CalY family protein [Bacillus infantis]
MGFKKKVGMGIASAALGMSLVGGGTFAYFNDVETSENTFAAGTLDLAVNPSTIVDVENIKPGDVMYREFLLENNGSLDISKVNLSTSYTVDSEDANTDDFGKHIIVHFLENADKTAWNPFVGIDYNDVISSTTLYDLKNQTPDAVESVTAWWAWFGGEDSGLGAGTSDQMNVLFEFVDNDEDQNEFQGDALQLKWTFEAEQTAGEEK